MDLERASACGLPNTVTSTTTEEIVQYDDPDGLTIWLAML